jgi:manganese transport protein
VRHQLARRPHLHGCFAASWTCRFTSIVEKVLPNIFAGNSPYMLQTAVPISYGSLIRTALPRFAGAGAAFAVSIGYMDPGNWATDLNAATYHYALLWAVVASGIAACVLQVLVIRFVGSTGRGLAEAIRYGFPKIQARLALLYICAIIATEISEFVGLTVGLQMVFHLHFRTAIAVGLGAFLLLLLAGGGMFKRFERIAIATTSILALSYAVELGLLHPPITPIINGALTVSIPNAGAWIAVVGIVGATIMPHNLFLQAGLFKAQLGEEVPATRTARVNRAIIATVGTLLLATIVNGAILVLGSATHATSIETAFQTLRPIAGSTASLIFGIALIGVSLAATAGGTCAGDIICADAPTKLTQLQRRTIALAPAVLLLLVGCSPTTLLVWSQVALAITLPAVVIPLFLLVHRTQAMKTLVDKALACASVLILIASLTCDVILFSTLSYS